MTNKLIRLGSSYTTPAVPYRPARAAYDTVQTFTGYNAGSQGWYRILVPVTNQDGSQGTTEIYRYDPNYHGPTSTYSYSVVTHHAADPGNPGTPAVRQDSPPQGWTSFAHSIAFAYENVQITFKAPVGLSAAAIGLSANPAPRLGISHIPLGLLATGGMLKKMRTAEDLGAYAATDTLRMDVDGGAISFKVNGVEVGTDFSTYDPNDALYMSAALYGAGDSIDAPTITQLAGSSPDPVVITVSAQMSPMVAVSFGPDASADDGDVPPSANFGMVHARMAPMTAGGYASDLVITPTSEAHARMAPMSASSLLLVGGLVQVHAAMKPMVAVSSAAPQMVIRSRMAPMRAFGYDDPVGGPGVDPGGVVHDQISLIASFGFGISLDLVSTDQLTLPIDIGFGVTLSLIDGAPGPGDPNYLELDIQVGFGVEFSLTGTDTLAISIDFGFDLHLSIPGAGMEVHAVNLKGGSTEYSNYPFNSFARIGDKYYGAAVDGLYLLDGPDDAGVKIQSIFCPGTLDFGTAQTKTIVEAYLGVASPSPMALKIDTPDDNYLYQSLTFSEDLKVHRFKLGKGVKANYLTPVIYNMNGDEFEVDSLEFSLATLSRKTSGRS